MDELWRKQIHVQHPSSASRCTGDKNVKECLLGAHMFSEHTDLGHVTSLPMF